jgi:hypothetical protein
VFALAVRAKGCMSIEKVSAIIVRFETSLFIIFSMETDWARADSSPLSRQRF